MVDVPFHSRQMSMSPPTDRVQCKFTPYTQRTVRTVQYAREPAYVWKPPPPAKAPFGRRHWPTGTAHTERPVPAVSDPDIARAGIWSQPLCHPDYLQLEAQYKGPDQEIPRPPPPGPRFPAPAESGNGGSLPVSRPFESGIGVPNGNWGFPGLQGPRRESQAFRPHLVRQPRIPGRSCHIVRRASAKEGPTTKSSPQPRAN
jgi:hypothetical protein